jgi:putative FmdB family regulatory protein
MPVYEYECKSCHRGFEYQQRMSDPEKEVCEACGGALERVISRTAFALKGGGWYKDLYASSKPESGKSSDGGGEGGGAASTTTSSDAPSSSAPSPAATPSPSAGSSSGSSGSSSSSSGSGSGGASSS